MKKVIFLIFCFVTIQNIVSAQTALKLKTGAMKGAKTVILPVCNNLLALLKADSAQFANTMKLYNYVEDLKTPGAFYANSTSYKYYIVKKKGDVAIMVSQYTSSLLTLGSEIKKRFPYAKHETGSSLEETYYLRVNINGQMLDCLLLFDKIFTGEHIGAQIKITDYKFN